jgi:hypothetical protein
MENQDGAPKKITRAPVKKTRASAEEVKKGQLLAVKAPPYYKQEYFYEVTSAGDKMVRATLYHSPTVRKSWRHEEFVLLIEMGIIRLAQPDEVPPSDSDSKEP